MVCPDKDTALQLPDLMFSAKFDFGYFLRRNRYIHEHVTLKTKKCD